MLSSSLRLGSIILLAALVFSATSAPSVNLGIFQDSSDIGEVLHPGAAAFDPAVKTYTITGSGENMWLTKDAFRFVWKQSSAKDATITANIDFVGDSTQPHRKAVLMFRQNLNADSAYADVTLHGNGLTSLQYRTQLGANTDEAQSKTSSPKRLRIVKEGDAYTMWLAWDDGKWQPMGGPVTVPIHGAYYIGLGVCSHDNAKSETAIFSNVSLTEVPR